MATILIGSYMVRYPLGGSLSWQLQYLTGLKDLGHDVYCLEKYVHTDSCYDPVDQVMTNDCSNGIKIVSGLLQRFGLADKWCFVGYGEEYYGLSKNEITKLFKRADLFIENQLIVELKAVRAVVDEHVAQLLGYLRASRIEHGLLVNFGAPKFQIKKYILNDASHDF